MLRFWKVTLGNLKIGKLSVTLANGVKSTQKLYSSKSFVTDKKTTWSKVQSTDQKKYLSKSKSSYFKTTQVEVFLKVFTQNKQTI